MRILRSLCWLYLALIGAALAADIVVGLTTEYGARVGTGCNFYDALLVGVECRGFPGARWVGYFLNWPLWLLYVPMLALSSFWLVVPAVLLWFPPAFLLASHLRHRDAT